MDLTRAVLYRTYDLNALAPAVGKPGMTGCSIDVCDMSTVGVDQYMDKASQTDGMTFQGVGNLYMGSRTFEMRGRLYGPTRATFLTAVLDLQNILDPVQAYRENQSTDGFLPLSYFVPTGVTTGARYVLARPDGLHYVMDRDKQGTNAKVAGAADNVALGMTWTCKWLARDPRIYGTLHSVSLTGGGGSGTWTNAGDYPSLLDCTFIVGGGVGSIHVVAGGADFTIPVAAGTNPRTIRYRGRTKYLTLVDAAVHATNEIFRRDMLVFAAPNSDTQHPRVLPGVSSYAVTAAGVSLQSGSSISFTDAWA